MGAVFLSLFIVLLYTCLNIKKFNVFATILITFYVVILIGALLCISCGIYTWYVSPFNLLLFSILYLFSANYFKKVKINTDVVLKRNVFYLNLFFWSYILIAILYIIIALPKAINNIISGDYLALYYDVRDNESLRFSSSIEKYIYILVSKFNYPALITGFIYLCKNKTSKGLTILIVAVISIIVYSVSIVSRGSMVELLVGLTAIYCIWRNSLPIKIKRCIKVVITPIIGSIFVFFIAITISRTVFYTDYSWILEYIGRSVLTFNSILEYPIVPHHGMYFLGNIDSFALYHSSYTGHEFIPLFAKMYIDFGIIGLTFIIFLPLCVPKRPTSVADIYLTVYFFITILIGLLYSGFNLIQIIQTTIIYVFLKFVLRI